MSTASPSRTSHSLSRRSANAQSARSSSGTARHRLDSNVSLMSSKTASTARDFGQSFESDGLSESPSRRKMKLEKILSDRQEADVKEREREQRKALLKERRLIGQQIVQARHASNEQQSKVKRGLLDINKVQTEIERLTRWREKENERLNGLMRDLIEEQQQLEQEYENKHGEASDIKATLEVEQEKLENELRIRVEETRKAEIDASRVEEELRRLDESAGIFRKDGFGIPSLDEMNGVAHGVIGAGVTTCSTNFSRFGQDSSVGLESASSRSKAGVGSLPDSISSAASSLPNRIGYGSMVIESGMRSGNRRAPSSDGNIEAAPERSRQARAVTPPRSISSRPPNSSAPSTVTAPSLPVSVAVPSQSQQQSSRLSQGDFVGQSSNTTLHMARTDSNASSMTQKLTASDQGQLSPASFAVANPPSNIKPLPAAFPIKTAESVEQRVQQDGHRRMISPVRGAVISNSQPSVLAQSAGMTVAAPRRRVDRSESPSPPLLTQGMVQKAPQLAIRQATPLGRRTPQAPLYNIATNAALGAPSYSVQQQGTSSPPVPLWAAMANAPAAALPVSTTGFLGVDV